MVATGRTATNLPGDNCAKPEQVARAALIDNVGVWARRPVRAFEAAPIAPCVVVRGPMAGMRRAVVAVMKIGNDLFDPALIAVLIVGLVVEIFVDVGFAGSALIGLLAAPIVLLLLQRQIGRAV